MPKQRESVKHAVENMQGEACCEQLACEIAFAAGVRIVIRGTDAFILSDGEEDHLCTAEEPKRLWWAVWHAMCERYPTLGHVY